MYFDHEKLTVYQKSIEFVAFVAALLPRRQSPFGSIRDQLLRSSQSIALNIAEGNGKRSPADRRRFFEIARGSAMESAATLDVLVAVGAFSLDEIAPGKALLFPVVKMLSKMTEHTEAVREEMAEYGRPDPLRDGEQEQEQD
ncbi:MAG TPA: four helix bundle protein [Candidatus Hydrogenedentes bacterium]|nr:four helix bundle protein [Candidatus Hydrogenedentota bacterium]